MVNISELPSKDGNITPGARKITKRVMVTTTKIIPLPVLCSCSVPVWKLTRVPSFTTCDLQWWWWRRWRLWWWWQLRRWGWWWWWWWGVTKIIALYWHPRYLYSGSNPSTRDNQGLHCVSHKPKKLSDRNELKLWWIKERIFQGLYSGVNDLWSGLFCKPFNMINMIEYFHHEILVSFVDKLLCCPQ